MLKRVGEVLSILIVSLFYPDSDVLLAIIAGYLCCIEILSLVYWLQWLWNKIELSKFKVINIEFISRKELRSLTAPLLGSALTALLGRRAGIFLFGYFGLYNEVAILSIVERIFVFANKFPNNFLQALLPFYSRVNKSQRLPIVISAGISFCHGIAGNFIYLTAPLWLQLWDISIDDALLTVLFLLAVNTICLGYLQSSSQLLLQAGILTLAFHIGLFRYMIFFGFLYFNHETLIDVVFAGTCGIVASMPMFLVFSNYKRSIQFLSLAIVSLFLLLLFGFHF